MLDLGADERATLALVAGDDEDAVLDGAALWRLQRLGLVEFGQEGWRVTLMGRLVADRSRSRSGAFRRKASCAAA